MAEEPKTQHYVDLWKQTITVQQHFNDISWRIRGLALTVMTFALGTAAITAREDIEVEVFGFSFEFASLVLWLGLVLWLAFYFVDKSWYHRLLVGAVKHGEDLEKVLHGELPKIGLGLTHTISKESPSQLPFLIRCFWPQIHSTGKLRFFYWVGAAVLVLLALGLQFGS